MDQVYVQKKGPETKISYASMGSYSNGDSREGNPGMREINWEPVPSPAPRSPWQGLRSTFSPLP